MSAALIDFVLFRVALGAQPLIESGAVTSEQVVVALTQRRKELTAQPAAALAAATLAELPGSAFIHC
jgi:hypothetical protein